MLLKIDTVKVRFLAIRYKMQVANKLYLVLD